MPLQPVSHDGQEYVKAVVSDQTISVRKAQSRSSSSGPVAFSFSAAGGTARLWVMRRPLEVESMVGKPLLWQADDHGMVLRLRLLAQAYVLMVTSFMFLRPLAVSPLPGACPH